MTSIAWFNYCRPCGGSNRCRPVSLSRRPFSQLHLGKYTLGSRQERSQDKRPGLSFTGCSHGLRKLNAQRVIKGIGTGSD